MGIGCIDNGVVVDAVVPDGVWTYIGTAGGAENAVGEGDGFSALVIDVVLVHVLEGKGTVMTWRKPLDHEVSTAVGA